MKTEAESPGTEGTRPTYTVTARMISAFRWAATGAIFDVLFMVRGRVTSERSVQKPTTGQDFRKEGEWNRTARPRSRLNALPLGQTDAHKSSGFNVQRPLVRNDNVQ